MPTINWKRGDTHSPIKTTPIGRDGLVATFTSGDAVWFHMADPLTGAVIVNAEAEILTGPPAQFQYLPLALDVAKDGDFPVEWMAVYGDGSTETFPSREADGLILHIEAGIVPARDEDVLWVRQQTLGAEGWSDDRLFALAQQWTKLDTDGTTVVPDLWAVAALVLEQRLLATLNDPRGGASQVRTGDTAIHFARATDATLLLRSYIARYWRWADPDNRAKGQSSGWRTVSFGQARPFQLIDELSRGQVVNGPQG